MKHKRHLLNLSSAMLPLIFLGIINIVKIQRFIAIAGNSGNGLYQLPYNIFANLSAISQAMGLAVCFSLYYGLVHDDKQDLSRKLSGLHGIYKRFALFTFVGAFALAFIFSLTVQQEAYSMITFFLINFWMLLRIPVIIYTYPSQVIYYADEKGYWPNFLNSFVECSAGIIAFAMTFFTRDFLLIISLEMLLIFIGYFCTYFILRKKTPEIKFTEKNKDTHFWKDMKAAALNRVSESLINMSNIYIISVLLTTVYTSIFATYNAIFSIISGMIVNVGTQVIQATFGKTNAKGDEASAIQLYLNFEKTIWVIASMLIPILYVSTQGFVSFIVGGEKALFQISFLISSLILIYIRLLRAPFHTIKASHRLYPDFRKIALLDALSTIILSVIFTLWLGVIGVVLGTLISLIFTEYLAEVIIIRKRIFNLSYPSYVQALGLNAISIMLNCFIVSIIWNFFYNQSFLGWIWSATFCGIVLIFTSVTFYFIVDKSLRKQVVQIFNKEC